jgi:hypothetical protein
MEPIPEDTENQDSRVPEMVAVSSSEDTKPSAHEDIGSRSQMVPDKEFLTLKNLDTGEAYVIGENDPDFEFDTFPLTGDVGPGKEFFLALVNLKCLLGAATSEDDIPWYKSLFGWLFGDDNEDQPPQNTTPRFTKLSSFKFRRELGKGAFGRVLLAESKADGSLYALKIISKKNMR